MQLFKKLNNRNFYLFIFFLTSILASVLVLIVERKVLGLGPLYHPDSEHYLKHQNTYFYLSLDQSFFENLYKYIKQFTTGSLYYSIVHLAFEIKEFFNFSTPYRNLIGLNIFFYALTNVLILNCLIKKIDKEKKIDFITIVAVIFFCFLPYKIHLSVNILKETLILFFLYVYVLFPNKLTFITSFIFGIPLRLSFVFYYLAILDFNKKFLKKYFPLIILTIIGIIIWYYKNIYSSSNDLNLIEYLKNRNVADMGGRDFDTMPNFSEYGIFGLVLRSIVWPITFLSGTFMFFSKSIYIYIIGLEIILLQILYYYNNKKLMISFGLFLFLFLVAIYANSYTAYIRYCYLAINLYFLKIILNK
jgi:hypothetical protein